MSRPTASWRILSARRNSGSAAFGPSHLDVDRSQPVERVSHARTFAPVHLLAQAQRLAKVLLGGGELACRLAMRPSEKYWMLVCSCAGPILADHERQSLLGGLQGAGVVSGPIEFTRLLSEPRQLRRRLLRHGAGCKGQRSQADDDHMRTQQRECTLHEGLSKQEGLLPRTPGGEIAGTRHRLAVDEHVGRAADGRAAAAGLVARGDGGLAVDEDVRGALLDRGAAEAARPCARPADCRPRRRRFPR